MLLWYVRFTHLSRDHIVRPLIALQIGDSAIATPGAGTSYAIESAYVLAGELSKIENVQEIANALKDYEKTFRPAVKQTLPLGVQMLNPQTPSGIWILNTLLWIFYQTGMSKLIFGAYQPGAPGWELPEYAWQQE